MSAEEVAGRLDVDEELDWTFSECPWGALPWKGWSKKVLWS